MMLSFNVSLVLVMNHSNMYKRQYTHKVKWVYKKDQVGIQIRSSRQTIKLLCETHTRFTKVDLEFYGNKIRLLFSYQSYIQPIVCHAHLDATSNGPKGRGSLRISCKGGQQSCNFSQYKILNIHGFPLSLHCIMIIGWQCSSSLVIIAKA